MLVVLPTPLTPTNKITVKPFGCKLIALFSLIPASSYKSTIFSMMVFWTWAGFFTFRSFTSCRKASVIFKDVSKPTSAPINVSSNSSKKSSSTLRKLANNSFNRWPNVLRVFSKPFSYFSWTCSSFDSSISSETCVSVGSAKGVTTLLSSSGASTTTSCVSSVRISSGSSSNASSTSTNFSISALSVKSAVSVTSSAVVSGVICASSVAVSFDSAGADSSLGVSSTVSSTISCFSSSFFSAEKAFLILSKNPILIGLLPTALKYIFRPLWQRHLGHSCLWRHLRLL